MGLQILIKLNWDFRVSPNPVSLLCPSQSIPWFYKKPNCILNPFCTLAFIALAVYNIALLFTSSSKLNFLWTISSASLSCYVALSATITQLIQMMEPHPINPWCSPHPQADCLHGVGSVPLSSVRSLITQFSVYWAALAPCTFSSKAAIDCMMGKQNQPIF